MCAAAVVGKYPWVGRCGPSESSTVEAYLNRCWRPQLSVIGADGLPSCGTAGNVLRPFTQVQLSIRLPPTQNGAYAANWVKQVLEADPPQGAVVSFEVEDIGEGWNAPTSSQELVKILERASQTYYGQPAQYCGEGGSIPFMKMLGEVFPQA